MVCPDGDYYVQITDPSGATVLGTSVGAANPTPIHVTNGSFAQCYQLWPLLIKGSDQTTDYDDTPNPGGEYKVWVSNVSTFDNDSTKTDNFKIRSSTCDPSTDPSCGHTPQGVLHVVKYYDANTNGTEDPGEAELTGWKFNIHDGISGDFFTPKDFVLAPDTYTLSEYMPIQTNWLQTGPQSGTPPAVNNAVTQTVTDGSEDTVAFGNVCLGSGGGLTLGFWSNKNGQKLVTGADLTFLDGLNLRNANGSNFDPAGAGGLASWLLSANATNMANMLSAQLAAMELNVRHGFVSGSALVYAPGTTSANAAGFATVNALMAEANAELGLDAIVLSGSPVRSYQEALKNALDKANNNLTFVQGAPCAYTF